MASAAPPKRMVSSVFITLASPYRATVTQQQPALQAHSAPARDKQLAAVRVSPVSPGSSIHPLRRTTEDQSPPGSYSSSNSPGRTHEGPSARAPNPQSPKPAQPGPVKPQQQEEKRQRMPEHFPLPPPPPSDAPPLSLGALLSEGSALSPPPPVQTSFSHPLTPGQQPVYNKEVETSPPSSGLNQDEHSCGIPDTSRESRDVCGFCRKPVALSDPAIEALNRTYHDGCFQCRSCHIPLAGKQYYNKAGIPLCEDCYQASLELCWACGEAITDHIIRALERAYHLTCFTCTTCKQQIGEQAFAQGEVGDIYCLQDYYRKYAPQCSACNRLIIPKEDGTDSYTVECLGRSYHENCYRCEVCVIQLSPEPNEHGCYPLDGKMLCKSCHLNLVSGQH
ncbi:filamin-binding LIM protein 1 [Parambassis ranga]|uniref:Filamin-binding LIM protein 1 n=1 Tax=Parambassis ranga TaxID=210632 RepID=A0A6P7IP85_9TELE|nr:filamin-binding LIM protein 1 [Parambassis ranga]XP_028262393.1 filamin-binding LIM protein 1 [Parambassis ranga]XP_028262394.1 filamin-binding LIM protein 1 [Parambassis ranga]